MSVIPITVFFSLGLVFFFVALFLREHCHRHFASAERDSLLPLADEQPRLVGNATPVERELRARSEPVPRPGSTHADNHSTCGCLPSEALAKEGQRGVRPPCTHCLREAAGAPLR